MNRRPMILTSLAVLAVMLVASAWAWLSLPADAQVPIHWGPDGQADDWADKTVGLLLLPVTALIVAVILAIIPRIEPRRTNLERSVKAYRAVWIGVMVLLGGLHLVAVAAAMGADFDMTRLVLGGMGLLFVVIGNYLPKVRSNFMMGVRTPWTLTSERSWQSTHRLAGRLFVIEGAVLLVAALVGVSGDMLVALVVAGVIAMVVIAFGYSYIVWRDDPERRAL